MKLVSQRRSNDCGVASLAMAAGISYEAARDAIWPTKIPRTAFNTKTRQLREAAQRLGLDVSSKLIPWAAPLPKSGRAVVKVDPGPKGNWHWIAVEFKRRKVVWVDPGSNQASVEQPEKVCSYLLITPKKRIVITHPQE